MSKRAAAAEATRQRIVEATMELHDSRGIRETSWDDIAERAGVGVGTVYRHFPSLEELMPACGALTFEQLALPSEADLPGLFDGAKTPAERIARLVEELVALYERGAVQLETTARERAHFDLVQHGYEEVEERLDAIVAEALRPFARGRKRVAAVRGLTSLGAWRTMREGGLSSAEVRQSMSEAVASWLAHK